MSVSYWFFFLFIFHWLTLFLWHLLCMLKCIGLCWHSSTRIKSVTVWFLLELRACFCFVWLRGEVIIWSDVILQLEVVDFLFDFSWRCEVLYDGFCLVSGFIFILFATLFYQFYTGGSGVWTCEPHPSSATCQLLLSPSICVHGKCHPSS